MAKLKSLVLFFFLVLCPLISWYYLKTGLDYRKAIETELKGAGHNLDALSLPDSIQQLFLGKTSLVFLNKSNISKDQQSEIFDQFSKERTFQFVDASDVFEDLDHPKFKRIALPIDAINRMEPEGFATIIDTGGVMRYHYKTQADIDKMVEHISLIFPKEATRDIVQKK